MNFTEDIISAGKERATRIKAFLEELELQMALGKAEAKDAFESEKKSFNSFLNSYRAKMHEAENVANEHRMELDEKFAALEAKISVEFPTAKRKFDKLKKETLQSIYELEHALKVAYGDVGENIQEKLDGFKDKLDAYRIQLALADSDAEGTLENRKAELLENVGNIREKLQQKEELSSKVDNFVEDISESFDKMKKAFSDLFA